MSFRERHGTTRSLPTISFAILLSATLLEDNKSFIHGMASPVEDGLDAAQEQQ